MRYFLAALLAATLAFVVVEPALATAPTLKVDGGSGWTVNLSWTEVPGATKYRLKEYSGIYSLESCCSTTSTVTEGWTTPVPYQIQAWQPTAGEWSNTVTVTFPLGGSTNTIGKVKIRYDARTFADSIPIEWFSGLARIMAYPPAGDRYPNAGYPTIAYHDAYTTFGSMALNPTRRTEYVGWVKRDQEHGYIGQMMDDIDWQSGYNQAGSPEEVANLIEAVRTQLGPSGTLEINSQYNDIKTKMSDPNVVRALAASNVVTKEFNIDPTSGINSRAALESFLAWVDTLHAKHINIVMSGHEAYNSTTDREYSLAGYYLLNDGGDFIGFSNTTPSSEWPGFRLDIGSATSPRERASNGVWKRSFSGGVAYLNEPGNSTQTVSVGPHHTLYGESVSAITLAGAHGTVLLP